jgi:GT2 family glycosyltransferase
MIFMNDYPTISVVVIGRNEGARLTRCLESVLAMNSPGPAEIIYVDSASIDDSVDRAERLGAKIIQVNPERPCAAAGRNAGWRAARAPAVLFLDGDTILAPDFISPAIRQLDNPSVGAVFGDYREIDVRGSIYNRILDLDWNGPPGLAESCGGNALIRREALERAGGFDERLIAGEDTELCSRIRALGYQLIHLDIQMIGHDLAISRFSQYWRRAVRTGHAYAEVDAKLRPGDSPIWYRQTHRNRMQGAVMLAIVAGAPLLSLALRTWTPIVCAIAIILALSVRTAMRTRWKHAALSTRLLHGVHSHLVQIPIFIGQLKYLLNRMTGRSEPLIEYKDVVAASQAPRINRVAN